MKIKIQKMNAIYYIGVEYLLDNEIAQFLNISTRKYTNILKQHNAFKESTQYYFKNREDAEMAFKALEPYIIMRGLTE